MVAACARVSTRDASGAVAGFADATGRYLPLACTLNASRVLDVTRQLLDVSPDEFDALALRARPGADGLVFVPYLEGERTPNLPLATGTLHGLTPTSFRRENLARAAVEGLLCLMADCADVLRAQRVPVERVTLIGGGARSRAVRDLAPAILGIPVSTPPPAEYVATGAARQAAMILRSGRPGSSGADWPRWQVAPSMPRTAQPRTDLVARYRQAAHS
ncbi:FGGY-family carbohydrate kinase [Frankia sp. AgPm24]|uniref:FGGY-family carbohydrate kinase n=1 Tax=Frankia sp. AgPm24 TaxID=631128 RepID=UPI00200C75B5|nr:FGGY-family carbohydrate kinase [Frankia sp. AgPm24]MCK9924014.1 FGGY-family carbohydrate kinase [Frankia sp. AgPm24]